MNRSELGDIHQPTPGAPWEKPFGKDLQMVETTSSRVFPG